MATSEHPLLIAIRDSVSAQGVYRHHWGDLRREAFPGQPAWINLRAWCADNDLECELTFGESSKEAEVQFRKAQPGVTAPLVQVATVVAPELPSAV